SQVSSVAFNSRYTIAIGYKQLEHITWCSHKSMIMVHFSMRRLKDGSLPSFSLVVQGCVSSLEFHKTTVSILAGGTLSGEIFIWDLNKDTTALLTIKNDPAIGQSDCISTVTSLVNGSFISSSIDGSVAVWAADKEINVKA
ncbi:cytoplasmic dynein 2 intermediate chain 2-like, partial [Artemia franciscana]|uniref:cytoplasmic dynein 2 intermediate chain 2-like n=1 Tax=Artemia franciscana TaxID=6661 RepID=UPI0032DAD083